jgi:hypothetical protein
MSDGCSLRANWGAGGSCVVGGGAMGGSVDGARDLPVCRGGVGGGIRLGLAYGCVEGAAGARGKKLPTAFALLNIAVSMESGPSDTSDTSPKCSGM